MIEMGLAALGGLLWYLLRQKDSAQGEQIKLLFEKHDKDAKELENLRLEIAKHHYDRGELDRKFEKLEGSLKDSFSSLERKLDELFLQMRNPGVR